MHDPFRLHSTPGPAPVAGDLPPPLLLVGEDDLAHSSRPQWIRRVATVVVAFFAIATVLTAAASSGAASLLTGGWPFWPIDDARP